MTTKPTLGLAPYITVSNAAAAIDWYVKAFGAEESFRLVDPSDGRIGHAELVVGGVTLMLSDEYPDFGALAPETVGGSPVKFQLYANAVDTMFAAAVDLGATEVRPVRDQFFGERAGTLCDPFGHVWTISQAIADVSPAEMQERWNAQMEG